MNILITFDNFYARHAITMLMSFFKNNKKNGPIKIWLASSDLSGRNLNNLQKIIQDNNACLKIINIDEDQLCNLPLGVHFTRANYYRILALDMIDAQKVLYLDVDLIITQNITSLWEQQLNNVILAAVDEQNSERVTALNLKRGASYFNSGVMLVNLELWRSSQISKKVLQFIRNSPELIQFVDQCGVNKIIDGEFLHLNRKYNFQSWMYANCDQRYIPMIVHFTGSSKPWQMLNYHPHKNLYWYYRQKTEYKSYMYDDFSIAKLLIKIIPAPATRILKKLIRLISREKQDGIV